MIHPFDMRTKDVVAKSNYNSGWSRENNFFASDKKRHARPKWFFLTHPIFWAVYVSVGYWVLTHLSFIMYSVAVLVGIAALSLAIYWWINKRAKTQPERQKLRDQKQLALLQEKEKRKAEKWKRQEAQRAVAAQALEADLQYVVCTGAPPPVKVSALPEKRRTVSLRLQEAKADVCRPFRR